MLRAYHPWINCVEYSLLNFPLYNIYQCSLIYINIGFSAF